MGIQNARTFRPVFMAGMIMVLSVFPLAMAQEKGKPLDGKQVFVDKCLKCHKPDKFKSQHHDRRGWEQILTRMELNTCVLSDAEASAVAGYLSKEFGE